MDSSSWPCKIELAELCAGDELDSMDESDENADVAGDDVANAAAVGKEIRRQGYRPPSPEGEQQDPGSRPRLPSWLERSQDNGS